MAEFMLIFNESSGTTVTNYGSAGNAKVDAETGGGAAQYTWNQDSGSYDGFLQIQADQGTNMTVVDLSNDGANTGATSGDYNLAMGFLLREYDTRAASQGFLYHPQHSSGWGGVTLYIDDPTSTGDFNLEVWAKEDDGTPDFRVTYADLSFLTFYQIAVAVDVSAPTLKTKLDAGSVQTDTTGGGSFGAVPYWNSTGPKIGRAHSFTNYYGVKADLYYFYADRGTDIAWDDTALANVNSNPSGTLDGWPSSGPTITSFQRLQSLSSGFGPHKSQTLGGDKD